MIAAIETRATSEIRQNRKFQNDLLRVSLTEAPPGASLSDQSRDGLPTFSRATSWPVSERANGEKGHSKSLPLSALIAQRELLGDLSFSERLLCLPLYFTRRRGDGGVGVGGREVRIESSFSFLPRKRPRSKE